MRTFSLLAAALLASATLTATAQNKPAAPAATPPATAAAPPAAAAPVAPAPSVAMPLTAEDANAWLDGYMPYALHTGDIAGAVVAIVKDGRVLTERGFGYSDVAARAPVDPKLTLFRPGSVSKLLTWTAVMQQVEQGKIDLDGDVNQYLDFKIPARDGKPVTMRNLMQHVAGFEEQAKGIMSSDPKSPDYETLLKQWVPERVFAAGGTPAYSNYGASLAGYIVQRVSGEPFDEYIEKHIFQPLDMQHSTFRQPLPANLEPLMSKGYVVASEPPKPYEIVGPAPAGALASPGEDMAHFMIAHLQDGEYHGNRILKAETAEMMHNSPLTILPPLNRMELGFFETNVNGREVIAHLGDTQYFHTSLHLFLKEGVGFYVSFNSPGKAGAAGGLRGALFDDFADRYFPAAELSNASVDPKTSAAHAALLAGHWANSRASQSNFLASVGLFGQTKAGVNAKGELEVPFNGLNGKPRHWVEATPFVWRDANSHERLAAKVVDGRVVRFSIDGISPFMVFDREPWYKNAAWLVPALYCALGALLLTALFWPITAIVRRRFAAALALGPDALRAYRLSKVGAILICAALGLWALTVIRMFNDLSNLGDSYNSNIHFAEIFGILGLVLGSGFIVWNLWTVWNGQRRWPAKLWSIVLTLSAFVVLWMALAFNLISLGTHY
ncbi:MAG TPA: serine hydrolase domain-containing protein [Steroidobacteraceae bacterium]|jgi:CubicO group peptidase (beta-lactamase class C family)|nr:serine hydrolase domain-containing protein [Steroidobacteraceae bacterium]